MLIYFIYKNLIIQVSLHPRYNDMVQSEILKREAVSFWAAHLQVKSSVRSGCSKMRWECSSKKSKLNGVPYKQKSTLTWCYYDNVAINGNVQRNAVTNRVDVNEQLCFTRYWLLVLSRKISRLQHFENGVFSIKHLV